MHTQKYGNFSGNFWWSKSENMKNLNDVNDNYLAPEMYICSQENGKFISLSQKTNYDIINNQIYRTD
jgi:hypothetical protein